MRVLVTDGNNRAALAITRSLGRAGHEVIVGEKQAPSLAQTSRYCSGRAAYPDPVTESDRFIEELARTVTVQGIDVLLPVSDITTFLVTRNRDRFPASCAIPFADADTVERAADKVGLVLRAQQLGVAVPRSLVLHAGEAVDDTDIAFPVVIKPRQSRIRTDRGWVSTGVTYARDREQLRRDLASRAAHEFPVLLQERVIGPGVGVFAYYQHGKAVAFFSHRRLRERPPWGGVSVLSESVPLCPLAREYATALLDDLGWHGVAMVEFKRDVRDGVPKLMEINGRFWGSLQLAIDAGVDFPRMLVERVEQPGRQQLPYQVGVKSRWIWGDVDSLLLTLRGGSAAPDRGNAPRLRAILDFAKVWAPGLRYDNPKIDDALPWLFETYRWFRQTAHDAAPAPHAGHAR
jgi:predicted ATP-grasp superfamily ATP-dependent carboligase